MPNLLEIEATIKRSIADEKDDAEISSKIVTDFVIVEDKLKL